MGASGHASRYIITCTAVNLVYSTRMMGVLSETPVTWCPRGIFSGLRIIDIFFESDRNYRPIEENKFQSEKSGNPYSMGHVRCRIAKRAVRPTSYLDQL